MPLTSPVFDAFTHRNCYLFDTKLMEDLEAVDIFAYGEVLQGLQDSSHLTKVMNGAILVST